jgi:acylphosphatase
MLRLELMISDLVHSQRQGPRCQLQVLHAEAGQEHWNQWFRHQCIGRQCECTLIPFKDGTDPVQVQGEAQGSDDAIKEFVQHLNKGPSAASVSGVEHTDISTTSGESGFNVQ